MEVKKSKKPTPQERWGQLLSGRLTDKQIYDLFDEFGMTNRLQTANDHEWVRKNLPNSPEELKKILKIELDKENYKRKEAAKPVKPVVQAPVQGEEQESAPAPTPVASPKNDGMGGPAGGAITKTTDMKGTTAPWATSLSSSLVKFNSDPNGIDPGDASTIWWVDHATKTMRPIMSMQALEDLYTPEAYQAALKTINVQPVEDYMGGQLKDYIDLGPDYGILEGQQAKKLDFNPLDLRKTYGQNGSSDAIKNNGMKPLNSFISFLNNPDSGISSATLDKVKNDPLVMALYMNGLAYGGYRPDDIYKDIKRRELIDQGGNDDLRDVTVINANINRSQYASTNSGRKAETNTKLVIPDKIGNVNSEVFSQPAAMLNDKYYELTDPENYDPTSQSFKDALDKIKPEFYDQVLKNLSARTESEKIIADKSWNDYKDGLEKTYGYKFEDNALAAWNQLQKLEQTQSDAGLSNSGIANEQVDDTLTEMRNQNKRLREEQSSVTSSKEGAMAQASYSPDQVQKSIEEDIAKGLSRDKWRATQWGLAPKEAVTLASYIAQFRKDFPNKTTISDDEIRDRYYNNIYDQNGNYRSTLYRNQQDAISKTKYGFSLNDLPGTSEYEAKRGEHLQDLLDKEDALQKTPASAENGTLFDKYGNIISYGGEDTVVPPAEQKNETLNNQSADPYKDRVYLSSPAIRDQYDPSMWKQEANGKTYLIPGQTLETAKKKTTTSSVPTSSTIKTPTYAPPKGYEAIKAPSQINNYQANNTISNNGTLYGMPKAPTQTTSPIKPPAAPVITPPTDSAMKRNLAAEQAFVKSWNGKNGRLPTSAEINQSVYKTATPKFS